METSGEILRAASKKPTKVRELLMPLVTEYEAACTLSRGPDERRRKHWLPKARALELELRKRMDLTVEAA